MNETIKHPADARGGRRAGRHEPPRDTPLASFGHAIGRTRFVVLLAVVAVLLVAVSLFLLGTGLAAVSLWHAWRGVFGGQLGTTDLTVEFLEIVSVMLKAVVFYLIGVGLYSLFISPLSLTVALGVETLSDLEAKVVNVVVVLMAVKFLEHFIRWENPAETLTYGAALAVVAAALVLFQFLAHRAKEEQKEHSPDTQARAQRELFEHDYEEHEIKPDEVRGTKRPGRHRAPPATATDAARGGAREEESEEL
jgi:uncharacterized membrane protein YqhA